MILTFDVNLLQQADSYKPAEKWGQGPGGRNSHTWGPIGRQRKAGNDRKLGDEGLSSKERRGKVGISQVQK